jgi:hypothetical protein
MNFHLGNERFTKDGVTNCSDFPQEYEKCGLEELLLYDLHYLLKYHSSFIDNLGGYCVTPENLAKILPNIQVDSEKARVFNFFKERGKNDYTRCFEASMKSFNDLCSPNEIETYKEFLSFMDTIKPNSSEESIKDFLKKSSIKTLKWYAKAEGSTFSSLNKERQNSLIAESSDDELSLILMVAKEKSKEKLIKALRTEKRLIDILASVERFDNLILQLTPDEVIDLIEKIPVEKEKSFLPAVGKYCLEKAEAPIQEIVSLCLEKRGGLLGERLYLLISALESALPRQGEIRPLNERGQALLDFCKIEPRRALKKAIKESPYWQRPIPSLPHFFFLVKNNLIRKSHLERERHFFPPSILMPDET